MRTLIYSSQFKKDIKTAQKRRKNLEKLKLILEILQDGKPLPSKNKDHALLGKRINYRECHIEPDWLLIYQIEGNLIKLARTGSHSDLF